MRVTVLLLVLVVVAAWGFGTLKRRWVRTRWTRPLEVGVVELATRSAKVPPGDRLDQGLVELEEALTRELHRYRGGPAPFKLTRLGPVRLDALPPLPPSGASAVERAQYTSSLQALAPTISEQTGQNLRRFDLLLYLRLEDDGDAEQRFVEGAGAAGTAAAGAITIDAPDARAEQAALPGRPERRTWPETPEVGCSRKESSSCTSTETSQGNT